MAQRIIGLETEYGCLVDENASHHDVINSIRDWLFENERYGLIDRHDRGWDEPAGNGGFLFNGGRVYIDMGHLEYCTPECLSLRDALRYDRAGEKLLSKAWRALGLADIAQIFRNNVDHYTGATFGCHENYSMTRSAPLTEPNVHSLLAFQTLRTVFTGAGRVGTATHPFSGHSGNSSDSNQEPFFQISQRADFIENDFYQWVQGNRAIINTRDEPLADPSRYRRLHALHGDTNVLPASLFLKLGATSLILDLLEIDDIPMIALEDAVSSLRSISRKLEPPWRLRLIDGQEADVLELLERYRSRAEQRFSGRDEETDAVLALWKRVLIGLDQEPTSLIGLLDWVSKYHLLTAFIDKENLDWNHPWLLAQDLEYHHIHPERSLGLAMAEESGPWTTNELETLLLEPPSNTRARARSDSMRELASSHNFNYIIDWDRVESLDGSNCYFPDPFDAKPSPTDSPHGRLLRSRQFRYE